MVFTFRICLIILLVACADGLPCAAQIVKRTVTPSVAKKSEFARSIEVLSEEGGYFDTDNIISNESSYLHVLGKMRELRVGGGAYIGVGPDQNFSYIAQIRPRVAYLVDIRRDNLLQHLFFKALFARARHRVEYLCLLFGKPVPANAARWNERDIKDVIDDLDRIAADEKYFAATRAIVREQVKAFGVPLSDADLAKIERIHAQFFSAGLNLKFTTFGRSPRASYPTYRDLLLETDLTGRRGNYLAREEDFQFIKSLQQRDLIIPVTGDLAGHHALREIASLLRERREQVTALYVSNVEYYLMSAGKLNLFIENLALLPHDERSLIIRSYFGGFYGPRHPHAVPGYNSSQLLQTIASLVAEQQKGGYSSYTDLITKHSISLR